MACSVWHVETVACDYGDYDDDDDADDDDDNADDDR